jgi:sterol desaturase/sphingolipid hydroxylase (fatty acid hydroxylase superfamily)
MSDWLLDHEPAIRLGAFLGVFAAMAAWEAAAPRRPRTLPRAARWPGNLGVVAVDALLLRFAVPGSAVAVAAIADSRGWGVLGALALPGWLEAALAVALLDLAIWAQHVVFHRLPPLWRLHRMHHADLDLDVSSGGRFHPLEILLSIAIKFTVIVALGASPLAVLIFEVLLNASSMFNHSNVAIPQAVDRLLRLAVVTPDMHRVHHSVRRDETDSNFGFCMPWWDRAFGTYAAAPRAGQEGMTIGLPAFRDPAELRLDRLLTQPFRSDQAEAAP